MVLDLVTHRLAGRKNVRVDLVEKQGITLALTSEVLAKDVFLQLDGMGNFSDNFFDIMPGDTIHVELDTGLSPDDLEKMLTIRTLRDTYR